MKAWKLVVRSVDLCALTEIGVPGSRGFSVDMDQGSVQLFVVRSGNTVVAYRNSCPHTGGPLDWVPDEFLSIGNDRIQCATHDALFRIEDGLCIKGPCAGQFLVPVGIEIKAGRVLVALDESGCK
jgi:nitrite reductase/ring-hydroxylating ferredoxin subunit